MTAIWQWIKFFDTYVFLLINHDTDYKAMDGWMAAFREPTTWIPLYIFMVVYAFKQLNRQAIWRFYLLSVAAITMADSISAKLLKPFFGRLRPCYEPSLHGMVRVVSGLGGIYSFPSSHASNHFALATFWFYVIWQEKGQKWHWLWIWAALICYAQVYVGNHYPTDVLAGAILGWMIGFLFSKIYLKWTFQIAAPEKQSKDFIHIIKSSLPKKKKLSI